MCSFSRPRNVFENFISICYWNCHLKSSTSTYKCVMVYLYVCFVRLVTSAGNRFRLGRIKTLNVNLSVVNCPFAYFSFLLFCFITIFFSPLISQSLIFLLNCYSSCFYCCYELRMASFFASVESKVLNKKNWNNIKRMRQTDVANNQYLNFWCVLSVCLLIFAFLPSPSHATSSSPSSSFSMWARLS